MEDTTVAAWADAAGWTRKAAYERRRLAEARLVAAMNAGRLSDPDAEVVAEATGTVVAERIPGPRAGRALKAALDAADRVAREHERKTNTDPGSPEEPDEPG